MTSGHIIMLEIGGEMRFFAVGKRFLPKKLQKVCYCMHDHVSLGGRYKYFSYIHNYDIVMHVRTRHYTIKCVRAVIGYI